MALLGPWHQERNRHRPNTHLRAVTAEGPALPGGGGTRDTRGLWGWFSTTTHTLLVPCAGRCFEKVPQYFDHKAVNIEEQNQQELGLTKTAVKRPQHSWVFFHSMKQLPFIFPFLLNISHQTQRAKAQTTSGELWEGGGTPTGDTGQRSGVAPRTEQSQEILRSQEGWQHPGVRGCG